jgi:hypothetical protein
MALAKFWIWDLKNINEVSYPLNPDVNYEQETVYEFLTQTAVSLNLLSPPVFYAGNVLWKNVYHRICLIK